jgi:hypothetical protein
MQSLRSFFWFCKQDLLPVTSVLNGMSLPSSSSFNKNIPPLNIFEQVIVQIIVRLHVFRSFHSFSLIVSDLLQGISSDAIILRVAIGAAWTATSGDNLATVMVFNSRNHGSDTRVTDESTVGRNKEKTSDIHLNSIVFSSRNHSSSTRVLDIGSTVGRNMDKLSDVHRGEMV